MHYFRISGLSRWVFACGLSLSTATQFRIADTSIGIGEIVLISSFVLIVLRVLAQGQISFSREFRPFLYFWLAAIALLPFGYYVAIEQGVVSINAGHDVLAWGLVVIVLLAALSCFDFGDIAHTLHLTMALTVTALTIILVLANLRENIFGNWDVMYGPRFRGWAVNPNQIAFQLSAIPFFILFYLQTTKRSGFLYILLVLTVVLGVRTQSDALILSWAFSGFMLIVLYLFRGRIALSKLSEKFLRFICYVVLPLGVVVLVLVLNTETFMNIGEGDIPREFVGVYTQGSQPMKRVMLWTHGIEAIRESPWVGYGPGPHSGITAPFYDEESHNTFIDWGTSSGLIGLFVYCYFLGSILKKVLRSGHITLIAAFGAIILVSMFHNTLRHPVFWFYLAAIIGLIHHRQATTWRYVRNVRNYS